MKKNTKKTYMSLLRNRILMHLIKGRLVWIGGGPGTGKTHLAKHLMRSKQFRGYFIPLIDIDNADNYRELLEQGGWACTGKYYFIDSYDVIKAPLIGPALVVSQTPPRYHSIVFVAPSGLDITEYLLGLTGRNRRGATQKTISPRTLLNIVSVIRAPKP